MSSFFTKPGFIDPITTKILEKDPGPLGKFTVDVLPSAKKRPRTERTRSASETLLSTEEDN